MRNLLLMITLCLAVGTATGQGTLYRSYNEYVEDAGERVDGPIDVTIALGRFIITYHHEGKLQRIPAKKLWGFMNRGILYRIEEEGRLPVRLMAQGAIYYWENGLAHLQIQRDSTGASHFDYGHASYVSRDLQGSIVPAVFKEGDTKSSSAKFKAAWPAYAELFDQIGEGRDLDEVRRLVVDYEIAVEQGKLAGP